MRRLPKRPRGHLLLSSAGAAAASDALPRTYGRCRSPRTSLRPLAGGKPRLATDSTHRGAVPEKPLGKMGRRHRLFLLVSTPPDSACLRGPSRRLAPGPDYTAETPLDPDIQTSLETPLSILE